MPDENIEVSWQVADDEQFTQDRGRGHRDRHARNWRHAVHVEVAGLEPARWYWYQFSAAGEASPVGRARARMPQADEMPQRLRFAFASCQHFETRLLTPPIEHMAAGRPRSGRCIWGTTSTKPWRTAQDRCGTTSAASATALDDYRNRHAQYQDRRSICRPPIGRCPWIVTWDDHEVENNYAGAMSEDHRDVEPGQIPRTPARAYQAYYEHMPLRQAQFPARAGHADVSPRRGSAGWPNSPCSTRGSIAPINPAATTTSRPARQVYDPQATLLGDAQEAWLYDTAQGLAGQVECAGPAGDDGPRRSNARRRESPTAWTSGPATKRTASGC